MQGGVLKSWHHLVVVDAVLSLCGCVGAKGTPIKISQTQTSDLLGAGGGGSWLLKFLLFYHYWCFPCEKLQ